MFLIILESILPTHAWLVAQSCRTLWPHGLQPARLLCPWDYPSKNTRVGCHFLLRRIFLTQGSNLHLPALAGRFSPTEPAGKPSCYTPKTFTLGSVRKTTSAGVHGRTVWTCGSDTDYQVRIRDSQSIQKHMGSLSRFLGETSLKGFWKCPNLSQFRIILSSKNPHYELQKGSYALDLGV